MVHSETEAELGRREFVRAATLLSAGVGMSALAGCADDGNILTPAQDVIAGRKWIRFDSVDPNTGVFTSVDAYSDTIESVFSSDVEWNGHAVLNSGEIIPVNVAIDQDAANSISLVSLGNGLYRLEAGGIPQPPGAPYEIHITERTIPGTEVLVFTGYSLDPSTGKKVMFSITHDPLPLWVILAIMAAIIAAAAQPAGGSGCAGKGGAKSRRVRIGNGVSGGSLRALNSGGLTATCTTSCNHDQGGGG